MKYSSDDEARFQTYAEVHLRSKEDLTDSEKISALRKKLSTKWIQLFINIAIIVVFAYMYFNGYTTFGDVFYYVLFGLFLVNIGLITLQRRQINELIEYIEYRIERGLS
jgi:hypothetical protein